MPWFNVFRLFVCCRYCFIALLMFIFLWFFWLSAFPLMFQLYFTMFSYLGLFCGPYMKVVSEQTKIKKNVCEESNSRKLRFAEENPPLFLCPRTLLCFGWRDSKGFFRFFPHKNQLTLLSFFFLKANFLERFEHRT